MADPPISPRFGALLRRLRTEAGLTQARLAERARLSQRGLQDLERGLHRAPHQATLDLLATALGLAGQGRAAFLAAAQAQPPPPAPLPPRAPVVPDSLTPLVGRAGELAALDRFLAGEGAPAAAPRALLLAGEPGIGKTRLLQAAAQRAVARGWGVLVGGCQRRGGEDPYAPIPGALAQHLALRPPERLGGDLQGCAWLVRLLPELAGALEPLPAAVPAPEQERRLIHAAVARFLANAAGPAGALLVLDDLQWAGPDALDLIDTLVRAPAAPVRLVGAYRDTEVRPADPLGLLLADLAQARLVRQRQLGPLAAADAAALIEDLLVDTPGGALAEEVLRRAGGTPFFLVSYAQALQQGGADEVPWDLAQGLRQRVALLPEAARLVLGAAAVVGRQVPRALLAAVAGQAEEAVLAGLEAACGARLLLEEGVEGYAFAHDLIREVLEADLGAARRATLHLRVAATLEHRKEGVSPELLAFHYGRGGAWEAAVRYLELAGDHAWTQRAHAAAESQYRAAADQLERVGRLDDAARMREKLAEVLIQAGHYDAAIHVLKPAAAAYANAADLNGQGRVAASMGQAYFYWGSPEDGIALLQTLLARLERREAVPCLAAVYFRFGQLLFAVGRYDECLSATDRAIDLARASEDAQTLVLATLYRGNILQLLGRLEEALCVDQEALLLAEAGSDLSCLVPVHRDLAFLHILRGDFATGGRHYDRSCALAEQLGNPGALSFSLANRGWLAALAGDMQAARAHLARAVAMRSGTDRSVYLGYVLIIRARLALVAGERTAATAALDEALALAQGSGDLQALRWAATATAETEILEGRPEAARARLLPLLDRPGLEECDVTTFLPVLAWAQLELGQLDEAAATVEQALRRARPEGMRLVLVEALRVQAQIALRRARWKEAADSLEEGLALARGMPYPYAEARLLRLDAEVQAHRGEQAAMERLAAARSIFVRLGARRDAAEVDQALADLSQNLLPSQNSTPPIAPGVSAAQWAAIAALLPPPARTGRRRVDDRRILEAILYQRRTGCAWAKLPAALGDGATAHRRWREWQAAGLWEQIAAIVGTTPAALVEAAAALRRED